jgi:hypothetical protein
MKSSALALEVVAEHEKGGERWWEVARRDEEAEEPGGYFEEPGKSICTNV